MRSARIEKGRIESMVEFHSIKAFVREEPRIELVQDMLKSILSVVDLEFEGRPVQVDGFRLRDPEHWRTVPETSLQQNLGSLSTACNCKCAFCYEDGNPEGLFERQPRFVGLAEAETRQRYLHDGKGLMRESKCFFEPLADPHYLELLQLIRESEPWHVIDVTTNGALLTPETVKRLAELKPVFVNLSLISASEPKRRVLMGDSHAASAIRAVPSCVLTTSPSWDSLPLPEQGLADIEKTVRYLDAHQARIIRVGVPGLSRHHPRYVPGEIEAWVPRLVERISKLRAGLGTRC